MTQISKAETTKHFEQIAELAAIIWSEHYTPIIGSEQVAYMLDKFQSVKAMMEQHHEGEAYYILIHKKRPVGYFCISRKEDALFLSKLYVLDALRGKGIGKEAMNFIEKKAASYGCRKVSLTVNKYNYNSIKAYEKMGFNNIKSVIQDIGNDYIMDDYLLEKDLITKGR